MATSKWAIHPLEDRHVKKQESKLSQCKHASKQGSKWTSKHIAIIKANKKPREKQENC